MPPTDRGQMRLARPYPSLYQKSARSQILNAGLGDCSKLPYCTWHPWAAGLLASKHIENLRKDLKSCPKCKYSNIIVNQQGHHGQILKAAAVNSTLFHQICHVQWACPAPIPLFCTLLWQHADGQSDGSKLCTSMTMSHQRQGLPPASKQHGRCR